MKLLQRLFSLLLIVSLITACGDDDNDVAPEPTLEEASLAFDTQNPPIEIPAGFQNPSDKNANLIVSQLTVVNALSTSFVSFFEAPEGATKSTTPIGRTSGRVAATQNEVVVYTYTSTVTDPNTNQTITTTLAYQITDLGTDFLFEFFFQFDGGDFIKYLEGKESKGPLKKGYLEIFPSAYDGQEATVAAITFQWNESADGRFEFSYFTDTFRADITVKPDNSGLIELYDAGSLYYEATWNAAGTSGTYTYYDNGTETDSGNWPS